jgi:predicted ArsR family transcriptional regulator
MQIEAMSDDEEDDFAQLHARADDIDTSKMAARLAEPNALRHKGIILKALETHGPMTSEEIAKMTGLTLWQCGRRVPDLRSEGFVVDTGDRRRNDSGREAAVWGLAKDQIELQFDPPPKKRSRKSLEDEIERLRAALRRIHDGPGGMQFNDSRTQAYSELLIAKRIAKEALGE